jgi:acetyl-CoA acetyltransferase
MTKDRSDRDPVIIDAVRTPVGRHGGALASVRPDDLLAIAIQALVERTGVPTDRVEDVIAGCANGAGEDNRNVGRMGGLLAGLPIEVAGQTINRLCGSGLQAIVSAGHAIRAGEGDVFVAGGVESMSRAPWVMLKPETGYSRRPRWSRTSTASPERIRTRSPWRASGGRAERSRRAASPTRSFRSKSPGERVTRWSSIGTSTHGPTSRRNDGAAAVLVTSRAAARELGLEPLARLGTSAVAGVDPSRMGIGPVPATRKALERAGLTVADLDLVELNEAFAAQSLPCIRELGLDPEKVNVNGGAIALGHPLGCTGAKLFTTLVHEMKRRSAETGLVTMCIGVGQGIATLVHREAPA